jgi:hypothetical protein
VSTNQRIHLYCLCWNDAPLLPHFLRHYDSLVERFVVYDNGSTDESLSLLESYPKVSVRHFDVSGDSFVEEERRLSDAMWRESQGEADWVIVVDIDELIFHPDLPGLLERCTKAGITALRGVGYEMVAEAFPDTDPPITESVTMGTRSAGHDKLCLFDPDALTHTGFGPGRHTAAPRGNVTQPERSEILLLHYKQLGVDYPIRRSAELRQGLREGDIEQGWGRQYLWSAAEIAGRWAQLRAAAATVPGLGSLRHVEPPYYDEEYVVRESGLFDTAWYLETYPDIAAAGANALSHFCIHGWREGRKPNFYFDTAGYLAHHPRVQAAGQNALIHYLCEGEREGAQPSAHFDPGWYREHYGIGAADSPLRHYLRHRASGLVSPLPDFDVDEYCQHRPPLAGAPRDPYEEYCAVRQAEPERPAEPAIPTCDAVFAALGVEPGSDPDSTTVWLSHAQAALRLFLSPVVVDEERYRQAYPDVAQAMDAGVLESARTHFIERGYFEGRSPRPAARREAPVPVALDLTEAVIASEEAAE